MSNKYIEALCTKPQEVAFGYDAYSNLSWVEKRKVEAGILRPQSTAGTRWHYAKEAAYKLGKIPTPSSKETYPRTINAFNKVSSAWTQYSLPPTSNKSAYYQGAIVVNALRLALADDSLAKRAGALMTTGDNKKLSTSSSDIQSAAKDVYKKIAYWLEKGGHSSEDKKIKSTLSHVRNYSRLSEIEFGKKLSAESGQNITDVLSDQKEVEKIKSEAIKKDIATTRKKRGYKDAKADIPFKNRAEGNAFRAWVNDNRPAWAKKEKLDRTGNYNNKYVVKAWKAFGQEYMDAMANKAFMERDIDDIAEAEAVAKAKAQEPAPMPAPSPELPTPFEENPFTDSESDEVGMMQLLEQDPAAFLKKYWYVPAGGLVGILGLAVGVRALTK
jgi:hypothetical protein